MMYADSIKSYHYFIWFILSIFYIKFNNTSQFKSSLLINNNNFASISSINQLHDKNKTLCSGDIVYIHHLRPQLSLKTQCIVKLINNSYGIVMQNISRINNRNKKEYLIEW